MSALWACKTSSRSLGAASRLSAAECELLSGNRIAWMSAMCVPENVTRTWTSPQRLRATGPVTVFPSEVVVVVLGGSVVVVESGKADVRGGSDVVGASDVVVDSATSGAAPVGAGEVWKFARRTRPPAVAARTGTARRMRSPGSPYDAVGSESGRLARLWYCRDHPAEPCGLFQPTRDVLSLLLKIETRMSMVSSDASRVGATSRRQAADGSMERAMKRPRGSVSRSGGRRARGERGAVI